MNVRKGEDWGERGDVPADAASAGSDREIAEIAAEHRRANRPIPPIVVTGGDLARTLGSRGEAATGTGTLATVDLGAVLVDGKLHWFVAHLIARRSWLRGRVVVAANAAFVGDWNIAPRAHPGDGRLDLLDGDPSLGDRLKARRRMSTGTHLPHPAISVRRVEAVQIDLDRPTPIHLDGHSIGPASSLSIRVEPNAVDVWI